MSKNIGHRPPDYYSLYKLPKTELIKMVYSNINHEILYIITSDKYADEYFLYKVTSKNNSAKKIKKQDNPIFSEIEKQEKLWKKQCEKDGDNNVTDI